MGMLMPEDFRRCTNCGSGWFREVKFVALTKEEQWGTPYVHRTRIEYRCAECDTLNSTNNNGGH